MTNVISAVLNATFRELKQTLLGAPKEKRPRDEVGGRRAKYKKNIYSRKAKLNEKNLCTPINPKKYSCHGLKLKFMKEFDKKKISAAQKFPTPPRNFSNGPSLIDKISLRDPQCPAFL